MHLGTQLHGKLCFPYSYPAFPYCAFSAALRCLFPLGAMLRVGMSTCAGLRGLQCLSYLLYCHHDTGRKLSLGLALKINGGCPWLCGHSAFGGTGPRSTPPQNATPAALQLQSRSCYDPGAVSGSNTAVLEHLKLHPILSKDGGRLSSLHAPWIWSHNEFTFQLCCVACTALLKRTEG